MSPESIRSIESRDYFSIGSDVQRGDSQFVMSQSALKLFDKNPWSWIRGVDIEETASMRYGSLVDCLYLTPDRMKDLYLIQPKVYPSNVGKGVEMKAWTRRASYCKKWEDDAIASGKTVITEDELNVARAAVRVLEEDPLASYLSADTTRQVACQWEYRDPLTGIVIPLKCMIDMVSNDLSSLIDFKTSAGASLSEFRRSASKFRYDLQGAFYLWGFRECYADVEHFGFIVSESRAPYPTASYFLTPNDIHFGREGGTSRWNTVPGYLTMLTRYARCLADGVWPQLNDGQMPALNLYPD